jgi:uncharacterized damage-inducible protein DinB
MTLTEIRRLYRYNAWANQRVLDSLRLLDQEQFTRDLKASHRSVRGTLAHLAAAEWVWLSRWRGISPTIPLPDTEFETVDIAAKRLTELDTELGRYVEALDEPGLNEVKSYRTIDGKPFSNELQEMLLHLINHSSYHRGQIAALLRQVGATPQGTDLISFFRTASS